MNVFEFQSPKKNLGATKLGQEEKQ